MLPKITSKYSTNDQQLGQIGLKNKLIYAQQQNPFLGKHMGEFDSINSSAHGKLMPVYDKNRAGKVRRKEDLFPAGRIDANVFGGMAGSHHKSTVQNSIEQAL
mmetsp:Transcript_20171/g.30933  ORF Transcript_20171/g.30933 Transcript_20171/m.30933 type:complete len:103 (-) Transcript_20171:546-854(-)